MSVVKICQFFYNLLKIIVVVNMLRRGYLFSKQLTITKGGEDKILLFVAKYICFKNYLEETVLFKILFLFRYMNIIF